jgi:hypothetical protein
MPILISRAYDRLRREVAMFAARLAVLRLMDYMIDGIYAPPLNAFRRQLGLSPVKCMMCKSRDLRFRALSREIATCHWPMDQIQTFTS